MPFPSCGQEQRKLIRRKFSSDLCVELLCAYSSSFIKCSWPHLPNELSVEFLCAPAGSFTCCSRHQYWQFSNELCLEFLCASKSSLNRCSWHHISNELCVEFICAPSSTSSGRSWHQHWPHAHMAPRPLANATPYAHRTRTKPIQPD